MKKIDTRRLVESAILIAIGFMLSFLKVRIVPSASVSLVSMLPIVLLAYKYGTSWGMLCGLVHGALQMIEGGIDTPPTETFFSYFMVVMLEYLFAFAIIGIGGLVRKVSKNPSMAIALVAIVGIVARGVCSFIAGVAIWGVYAPEGQSAWVYSLVVNGTKFGFEIIFTVIVAAILLAVPVMRKYVYPVPSAVKAA